MANVGYDTWGLKQTNSTVFIVQNNTAKSIKLFNVKIRRGYQYDLMNVSGLSEADIRQSLLKGALRNKLSSGEFSVVSSTINLLQFDSTQLAFLQSLGITNGVTVTGSSADTVVITESTTARTLILTDANCRIQCTNGSAVTITVPTNAVVPFTIGTTIMFDQVGAGKVTASGSGVTFRNTGLLPNSTASQNAVIAITKTATDTWSVTGERG